MIAVSLGIGAYLLFFYKQKKEDKVEVKEVEQEAKPEFKLRGERSSSAISAANIKLRCLNKV